MHNHRVGTYVDAYELNGKLRCARFITRLALRIVIPATSIYSTAVGAQDFPLKGRLMTVADMVQTAVIGDPGVGRDGGSSTEGTLTSFSPDGRRVAIVVHRWDLARNVVTGSLLIFRSADLVRDSRADTIATFHSTSNRFAISQIRWLSDNTSLLLVGEHAAQLPQIYRVDVVTHEARQLTTASAVIGAYAATPGGDHLVYTTVRPPRALADTTTRAGRVITAPHVAAVLGFNDYDARLQSTHMFAVDVQRSVTRPVPDIETATVPGDSKRTVGVGACDDDYHLVVSPDGRYVMRSCHILNAPDEWRAYSDPLLRSGMEPGGYGPSQYVVFDLQSNTASVLMDAPLPLFEYSRPAPVWLPDEPSVIISNVYLPIGRQTADRDERISTIAVTQVNVATGALAPVASGMSRRRAVARVIASRFDAGSRTLYLAQQDSARRELPIAAYQHTDGQWVLTRASDQLTIFARDGNGEVALTVVESLNDPPRLIATEARLGIKAVVLDPKPELASFQLGRVAETTWRSRDGTRWRGALYYPPNHRDGSRYPLVIQTYGYDPGRFLLDGPFPTGFAAQPLAAAGLIVLQMSSVPSSVLATPREPAVALSGIESAIDHLATLGLVDRSRVGVLGFSRTALHVSYALTHSTYPIAAAVVIDGVDMSYVSYSLFSHIQPFYETLVGAGPPFGRGLDAWRREAPGFNLDKVKAAVRIVAIGPVSVLGEWETFSGLRRLGKAVELVYFPDGAHLLFKPRERYEAAEGTLEWFRFWLLGEEDGDPSKSGQYARWRGLRVRGETRND